MDWPDFDWKTALKTIAPTVASIFGTPLAGAGVSMLLNAIFPDDDNKALSPVQAEDKLAAALHNGLTPEQYVAMQKADIDFKTHCLDVGVKLEELANADVANARARDVSFIAAGRSNTRANVMLACATITLFAAVGVLVLSNKLGLSEAGQIVGALIMLVGNLTTYIGQAFGFEFGTSRGGQEKTQMIATLAAEKGGR